MLAGGLYERTSGAAGQPLGSYQRRARLCRYGARPAFAQERLAWTSGRVFADDVLQCPCRGRRSVVAIVTDATLARSLLAGLGLAAEPVTFAPARAPPQPDLPWDDAA